HGKQVREAARMIAEARRPVLYVGGGVIKADAASELKVLAEMTQIPVVTTLTGRGAFPDSHELHLGMPGMHGTVAAVGALQKSDLLVCLGARFDDRVTGKLDTFAPDARIIHADIDPAEISKNRIAEVPIVGDCREVIADLIVALGKLADDEGVRGDYSAWRTQMLAVRAKYPVAFDAPETCLVPQQVIQRITALIGPQATCVAGGGQHKMWASQFVDFVSHCQWLQLGWLCTIGYL